jgi:TrpR-related protein YerC/YecD
MDNNQNIQKDKNLLIKTFRELETRHELADFLEDLLTEDEFVDFAQRIKIAKSILEGKTYEEIAEKVDASTATISKVGQAIKYGKGAFQKLFSANPKQPK